MKKMIICTYALHGTNHPVSTQHFVGKDINEASILAANYQSRHPELIEIGCKIQNFKI